MWTRDWKAFAAMIALICPLLGMHLLPLILSANAAVAEALLILLLIMKNSR